MAKIRLDNGPGGSYLIVNEETGKDRLIQTDSDFPSIARTFGWAGTENDSTLAGDLQAIFDATDYLDENIGATAEDPGYFD